MSQLGIPPAISAEGVSIIAELKAGSEDAYAWLVTQYHQPIYSLICRLLNNPADAVDTTQEVFLKVYRGMKRFNGDSSLKTWMYRIAIHEASNQRRRRCRHRSREISIEQTRAVDVTRSALKDCLVDDNVSPFENVIQGELRAQIEMGLQSLQEPYRTAVILRDLEGLSL